MSLAMLPIEMTAKIVERLPSTSTINPSKITKLKIKEYGRNIVNLSLANNEFKELCNEKIECFKKILVLVSKYRECNSRYERPPKCRKTGAVIFPGGNPQLYDALLTGTNFQYAPCSKAQYTLEIEEDIKTIVRLTPQSMNWNIGILSVFDDTREPSYTENASPLFAACINVNIPTSIVEFLLESGANPNVTINTPGVTKKLISEIEYILCKNISLNAYQRNYVPKGEIKPGGIADVRLERYNTIKELFIKHGFDSNLNCI